MPIPTSRSSSSSNWLRCGRPIPIHDNLTLHLAHGVSALEIGLAGVHADTLLAQEIDKQRAWLVVPVGERGLVVLVLLDTLDVLVEEVRRIEWAALGFGMELSAEDGAGVVDETFIGLVVQVGEVLPPILGKGGGVHSITVVLRCDVAPTGGEVESWNVVSTVSVLQLDRLRTGGESNQLVTHANAHDGDLGALEQFAEVVHGGRAVGWVTRTIGNEDTVEVVSHFVDGVIKGEASDTGTSGHKAAKDVLLHTAVDQSDVHVSEGGAHVEWSLGADPADQVDGFWVHVGFIFIGIVLLANGDTCQRGTLLSEVSHYLTGVDARDGRDTLPSAPLGKTLNGSPVAMPKRIVLDNNARRLNVRGLKVSE